MQGLIERPLVRASVVILLCGLAGIPIAVDALQKTSRPAPAARYNHAMTYDEAGGPVLMFGGANASQHSGDLWAWDGRAWTQLSDSGPSRRDSVLLAYDTKRRRTVLYGGRGVTPGGSAPVVLTDIWEWDGSAWHSRGAGPPAGAHAVGAYDKLRGRLVIYGGLRPNGGGQFLTDTWVWDGEQWSQRSSEGVTGVPNQMVYDERRQQVVMRSGATSSRSFCF